MNHRKKAPEKRLKSNIFLFVVVVCGILAACSSPAGPGPEPDKRSEDYGISNLTVNGESVLGESPDFSADVESDVTSVKITFNKPAGSTAIFNRNTSGGAPVNFNTRTETFCQVLNVALNSGANSFTITITSERGISENYDLTVNRGTVLVDSITLKSGTIELDEDGLGYLDGIGTSGTLEADVEPFNATNKNVLWSSYPTGVVTLNNYSGLISSVARGKTTIRATAEDGSEEYGEATIKVRSKDNFLTGLMVDGNSIYGTSPFTAGVEGGITSTVVTFTKSAWSTATFSGNGRNESFDDSGDFCTVNSVPLNAASDTFFTITITSESGSEMPYTLNITHDVILVTSITLKSGTITLDGDGLGYLDEGGISGTLEADILPINATNKSVIWKSSNESVATVAGNGLVVTITPLIPGTTTIRATADDGSEEYGEATIKVRSNNNKLSDLKVNGEDAKGTSPNFTAEVENGVTSGTITFKKPAEASAMFTAGVTSYSVDVSANSIDCTVSSVPFPVVGSLGNTFTITITSESGNSLPFYNLTVIQKAKLPETIYITINWEEGEDLISADSITITTGSKATIKLVGTISGPYQWLVDSVPVSNETGDTFVFNSTGRPAKASPGMPYIISLWAGNKTGDAITIWVKE